MSGSSHAALILALPSADCGRRVCEAPLVRREVAQGCYAFIRSDQVPNGREIALGLRFHMG
jgi:hypothetical protein